MPTNLDSIGFIGIGLMGEPMTLRLLNAGYSVNVWNRTQSKLNTAIKAGANECSSVQQLVENSDIILLCLANTQVVETLIEKHVLTSNASDKLIIDMSSIHPATTRRLAKKVKQQCNMRWVDAPVSGGTAGAKQGTLAIMAGGDNADIVIAKQILKPLYNQLTHMGAIGSGQITKICNQMIVSCNVMVIAEMIALAEAAGVDATKIPDALAGGFADSKPLQIVGTEMANKQFEPIKWHVKTLLKDLNMATDLSSQFASATPMSGLAAQLMQLHGQQGFLDQDPATLIKLYSDSNAKV